MTNLNYIYLGWFFGKDKNLVLENQVKSALIAWNKRKDLKDYVPDTIVFNDEDSSLVGDKTTIEGLDIVYSSKFLKRHFFIRGNVD